MFRTMAERTDYAVLYEQTDAIRIKCDQCGKERELDVLGVRNEHGSAICPVRSEKGLECSADAAIREKTSQTAFSCMHDEPS